MRVRAFRSVGDPAPIVAEVSTVIIEKDDGTPVAVAARVGGDLCCFAAADDPNFNRFLRTLGIDRVVVSVDDLTSVMAPPGRHKTLPNLVG